MNLTQLQSFIAPIAAPAAPAIILGSQVYNGMVAGGVPGWLASVGAIGSGAGMELAGALMFSMALVAFRRGANKAAVLALCGVVAYAAFAGVGVSTATNGGAFLAYVGVSLVAFGGSALKTYMDDTAQEQLTTLALTKARAAELRAQARVNESSKTETFGNFPQIPETFRDWRKLPQAERESIRNMTTEQIIAKYHVQERTARNWKANAQ